MGTNTLGFHNAIQRNRHFQEHGADFSAASAEHYEQLADAFLAGSKPAHVEECTRSKGDVIRYNPRTQEFGIVSKSGVIRSYFKPVPCIAVPMHIRAATRLAGRCHKEGDNFTYFKVTCLQH